MMQTLDIQVQTKIAVSFTDVSVATEYFIGKDDVRSEWSKYFHDFDSLADMFGTFSAYIISLHFKVKDYWDDEKRTIDIEGLPKFTFECVSSTGCYVYGTEHIPEIGGHISIAIYESDWELQ